MLGTRHDCPTDVNTIDVDSIVCNVRIPLMAVPNEPLDELLYVPPTMHQRSAPTNEIHKELILDKPAFRLVTHYERTDIVINLGTGHAGHNAHVNQSSELADRCIRISDI